jgi:hypothetical protein
MEEWKVGRMERWNVEVIAEIPPQREKFGKMEDWKDGRRAKNEFLPSATAYCELPTANCPL